ncbi:MAG: glutamine-hydrolyzing GMP synthase [Chlorobi bacterium]|nr:glutamine-hydrolyzing GMP synthase [Chlorobiota bacterium]MCI0717000.1 glutamine-hydrolyzing GMP synthase [Chlorobiota bacterium]
MNFDKIIIIDFGSQYTKLIARKVRECRVYSEVVPCTRDLSYLSKDISIKGIILSGGPQSVYFKNAPQLGKLILDLNLPILGICYGLQLLSHYFKGKVTGGKTREYGKTKINRVKDSRLFKDVNKNLTVWMSHGDYIKSLPNEFYVTSRSENKLISSFESKKSRIYGVQFHPEVNHTEQGTKIIKNYLFEICKVKHRWQVGSFIDEKVYEIREKVEDEKAICALSGGVDSTVSAYLVNKAIGKNLLCVHIDNGLMRKNESRSIVKYFSKKLNLKFIDASDIFLRRLRGIDDPEKKRKIVGKTFIDVFQQFAKRQGKIKYLIQGTLYPDVVESSSFQGPSVTIKTHHNVGGLPKSLHMKLIEPFRELFKDEVRQIGKMLKIPNEILSRHPFPGPGLAVRVLGEVTKEKLELLREADYIYISNLHKYGLYNKIWQAFCVLLPVSTVGVMGDRRTYERVLALRAVESVDGMTANWFHMPHKAVEEISTNITNNVKGINRVVYDVSNKPPSTIEWE